MNRSHGRLVASALRGTNSTALAVGLVLVLYVLSIAPAQRLQDEGLVDGFYWGELVIYWPLASAGEAIPPVEFALNWYVNLLAKPPDLEPPFRVHGNLI